MAKKHAKINEQILTTIKTSHTLTLQDNHVGLSGGSIYEAAQCQFL